MFLLGCRVLGGFIKVLHIKSTALIAVIVFSSITTITSLNHRHNAEAYSDITYQSEIIKPLDDSVIETNQQITATSVPETVYIIVNPGDTLSKIASQNNTTFKRIYDANPDLTDPDKINPGQKLRIPSADEKLVERNIPVKTPVVTQAAPTKAITVASIPVGDGSVWDRLAACESGGRWNINTGNGYYGGLQFSYGTWLGNGGGAYAPTANLATREQQIEIASRLQSARGWSPWPACARKLGLI